MHPLPHPQPRHALPLKPRAVVFDYGNTLIEFTAPQLHHCDSALRDILIELFGPLDYDRLVTLRNRDRVAPYEGDCRENDIRKITRDLVLNLYQRHITEDEMARILSVRQQAFVDCIQAPDYLADLLNKLKPHYKLGLLSNYPCADSIRLSLQKLNLAKLFDAIVVSAEVGYVKPHHLPFKRLLDQLEVPPHQAIYIGDNWLGDIQGAKRAGMTAIHIVQWDTPEKFDRQPGDHDADFVINHLTELQDILNIPS